MTKRTIWVASLLTVGFLLLPASLVADPLNQTGTSTAMVGNNHVTWDSNFVYNDFTPGTEVTMRIDWNGSARVAGMVSLGMSRQFTPPGAKGEIVGIERLGQDAALVTVRFTSLSKGQGRGVANAFLHINLAVDDGSGRIVVKPFPVKCHVVGKD